MGYSLYTFVPANKVTSLVEELNKLLDALDTPQQLPRFNELAELSYVDDAHKKKPGIGFDYSGLSGEARVFMYALIIGLSIRFNANKYYYDGEATPIPLSDAQQSKLISLSKYWDLNPVKYRKNGLPEMFSTDDWLSKRLPHAYPNINTLDKVESALHKVWNSVDPV